MDEAAIRKNGKKKASPASVRKAGQRTREIAALLSETAPAGSRLVVDVPLSGKGQVRLVLSEPARRISVWGADMDEAMKELLARSSG